MIPLRDVIPSRTTPWVTYGLIALNVVIFLNEVALPDRALRQFLFTYGLTPAHFTWASAVTSMFVHAGWAHIGGNMLSLWIFGDNVEDRFGHIRYLIFYLLTGLIAGIVQTWAVADSLVPVVGASGAIAGVMGAYFLLFPQSRVLVLVFLFVFIDIIEIPAVLFLGFWFLLQLFSGIGSLGDATAASGVGFWAHIGGFLTGLASVWVFRRPERQRVDWWT